MNEAPFKEVVTEWLASQAFRRLRDTDRAEGAAQTEPQPGGLRIVAGAPEERYVTCVPLVPLAVAAGAFGGQ